MSGPQAYLNGAFIPAAQALVSVSDGGFVQGTTIAEQLRTFNGKLFRLEAHVERLFRSLEIVGVDPQLSRQQFVEIASHLGAHNHALLAAGDDLNLTIFVTPGPYMPMIGGKAAGPTVCVHSFPLRFDLWARKYTEGEALATTSVAQVSHRSWPPELKCRSRMHYYLADREAQNRFPGSRALMLDDDGFVTESTTANIVLKQRDHLLMPRREKILPGISLAVLEELASQLGLSIQQLDLKPDDVATADEVFLTSTSICMLPVVRFNGSQIGDGRPGPLAKKLLDAWGKLVGLDIAEQARRFAGR